VSTSGEVLDALDGSAPASPPRVATPLFAQVRLLLSPKWLTFRARVRRGERGHRARSVALLLLGAAFWAGIFVLIDKLLAYFKGVPEIGPLLAGKVLGTLLVGFFSILMLSNVVSALSSFFLARDLDLAAAAPADWLAVYTAKLIETAIASSWMVGLMAVPILAAYGVVFGGGPLFPLIALAAIIPYFILPAVLGSALTLLLVNVFPARRTRDILSVIAIFAAAGVVLMIRLMRPERLARPEGFRSLVEFVAVLKAPASPWLPSEWSQHAIMSWLQGPVDPLPFYLLWSTAAAAVALGAALHYRLYPLGFSKAQESSRTIASAGGLSAIARAVLGRLSVRRRELVLKELRVFFRDTTQWSQLILLAVLLVVYVFNIKFLPITDTSVGVLLRNLIPFVNLLVAGFVLASIAARFIFPGVSLEGRTFWLLRASPLDVGDLLWAKYWVGTLPLLVLALLIVSVTDALLHVDAFILGVSVTTILLMTLALAAMALCFGTIFPQFETENAAQIPTSFGGLVFMMSAVVVIGAVVFFEARPVYNYLSARMYALAGTAPQRPRPSGSVADMVIGFGLAGTVCVAATVIPLKLAFRRLALIERA
jgi:ABC-2 type transport system permease protein